MGGLYDPVGLHGVGDYVAVSIGSGDLSEGEFLASPRGACVAQQVAAFGGACVLDAHCHGGGAHSLVEVVVGPGSGGAGGVHR